MAKDFGRDLDIGIPRDEALNVRVSIDEVIDAALASALEEKVTKALDVTNLELQKIKEGTGLAVGVDLDKVVC